VSKNSETGLRRRRRRRRRRFVAPRPGTTVAPGKKSELATYKKAKVKKYNNT
jgi:hypothetical protein